MWSSNPGAGSVRRGDRPGPTMTVAYRRSPVRSKRTSTRAAYGRAVELGYQSGSSEHRPQVAAVRCAGERSGALGPALRVDRRRGRLVVRGPAGHLARAARGRRGRARPVGHRRRRRGVVARRPPARRRLRRRGRAGPLAVALDVARSRVGERAEVSWIEADLRTWQPSRRWDAWHDRAVLHFLVDEADRATYVERLRAAVVPGGAFVIGTFAETGRPSARGFRSAATRRRTWSPSSATSRSSLAAARCIARPAAPNSPSAGSRVACADDRRSAVGAVAGAGCGRPGCEAAFAGG